MRQAPKIIAGIVIGFALATAHAAEGVCPADAKLANLNFTFKDIHGKLIALSDYKGKVVVLDFWATWCPPCRKEIPGFIELYNSYRSRGFVVIGVSMDESKADVKRFANKLKINYPIVLGAGRDDLQPAFGDLPLPTSFVIGRDGRICGQHDGLTSKDQYEREISALLVSDVVRTPSSARDPLVALCLSEPRPSGSGPVARPSLVPQTTLSEVQ